MRRAARRVRRRAGARRSASRAARARPRRRARAGAATTSATSATLRIRTRGGAVDSRTTSVVASSTRSASTRWPSSSRISRLTPSGPSRRAAGGRSSARASRSPPAPCRRSRRSRGRPGTRRPSSRAASSAPIATLSLKPKIAVGGRAGRAAARPPRARRRDRSRTTAISAGSGRMPAAASAARKPMQPLLARVPALGAGDAAMRRWPSSSRCSVAGSHPTRARRDARDPVGERLERVDDDERVALPLQRPQLVRSTPPAASGRRRRSCRASAGRAA